MHDKKADIKTELEIIESYLPWKEYMDKNEMPKSIEADIYKKAEAKWVSMDFLLMNLNSWLEANDYAELKQCVEDFIDELKEG